MIIKVNRNTEGVSYPAAHTPACVCEVGERAKQPSRLCQRWSHYLELLKSRAAGWLMRLWRSAFGTEFIRSREFGSEIDLAQDKMLQPRSSIKTFPASVSLVLLFCRRHNYTFVLRWWNAVNNFSGALYALHFRRQLKMLITSSQSFKQHLQMFCFVQTTIQNLKSSIYNHIRQTKAGKLHITT